MHRLIGSSSSGKSSSNGCSSSDSSDSSDSSGKWRQVAASGGKDSSIDGVVCLFPTLVQQLRLCKMKYKIHIYVKYVPSLEFRIHIFIFPTLLPSSGGCCPASTPRWQGVQAGEAWTLSVSVDGVWKVVAESRSREGFRV